MDKISAAAFVSKTSTQHSLIVFIASLYRELQSASCHKSLINLPTAKYASH